MPSVVPPASRESDSATPAAARRARRWRSGRPAARSRRRTRLKLGSIALVLFLRRAALDAMGPPPMDRYVRAESVTRAIAPIRRNPARSTRVRVSAGTRHVVPEPPPASCSVARGWNTRGRIPAAHRRHAEYRVQHWPRVAHPSGRSKCHRSPPARCDESDRVPRRQHAQVERNFGQLLRSSERIARESPEPADKPAREYQQHQ